MLHKIYSVQQQQQWTQNSEQNQSQNVQWLYDLGAVMFPPSPTTFGGVGNAKPEAGKTNKQTREIALKKKKFYHLNVYAAILLVIVYNSM